MADLKVKAFGTKGYMICIGEDGQSGEWYFMTDGVKQFIKDNVKVGDTVIIKSEKTDKRNNLIYINKSGSASPGATGNAETKKWEPKSSGGFQRSPADNESIKRQAIGHMTSRILAGQCTSGMIQHDQVEAEMERLYKKFQSLVG